MTSVVVLTALFFVATGLVVPAKAHAKSHSHFSVKSAFVKLKLVHAHRHHHHHEDGHRGKAAESMHKHGHMHVHSHKHTTSHDVLAYICNGRIDIQSMCGILSVDETLVQHTLRPITEPVIHLDLPPPRSPVADKTRLLI